MNLVELVFCDVLVVSLYLDGWGSAVPTRVAQTRVVVLLKPSFSGDSQSPCIVQRVTEAVLLRNSRIQ